MPSITGYEDQDPEAILGVTPSEAAATEKLNQEILRQEQEAAKYNSALGGNIKARASILGGDPEKYRGNQSQVTSALREGRQKLDLNLSGLRKQREMAQTAQTAESRRVALERINKGPNIDRDFVVKALSDPASVQKEYDEGLAKFQAKAQSGQANISELTNDALRLGNLAASLDFRENKGPFFRGKSEPDPATGEIIEKRVPGPRSNQFSQIVNQAISHSFNIAQQAKAMQQGPQVGGPDRQDLGSSMQTPEGMTRQPVEIQAGGTTPFSSESMRTNQELAPGAPRQGLNIQGNELVAPEGKQLFFTNRNPSQQIQGGLVPLVNGRPDLSQFQANPELTKNIQLANQAPLPATPQGAPTPAPGPVTKNTVLQSIPLGQRNFQATGQAMVQPEVPSLGQNMMAGWGFAPPQPEAQPPPLPANPVTRFGRAAQAAQQQAQRPTPVVPLQPQAGPTQSQGQSNVDIIKVRAAELLKTHKPEEVNAFLAPYGLSLQALGL